MRIVPMVSVVGLLAIFTVCPTVYPAFADKGRIVEDVVYATSLEGNMLGTDPNQPFQIYLPPGYDGGDRHYPTVYLLDRAVRNDIDTWAPLSPLADKLISDGTIPPTILVMPNGSNILGHTFFANSPVIGDWTRYLAVDLVQYVETHYRAMKTSASRGVFGIASGGTGALEVAFHFPEVFSQVYAWSPFAIHWPFAIASFDGLGPESPVYQLHLAEENYHTIADWASAPTQVSPMLITFGQIWAPEVDNPPLYMSHVSSIKNEKVVVDFTHLLFTRPMTLLNRTPNLVPNIKRLRQIGFASGLADFNSDPTPQHNLEALAEVLRDSDVRFEFLEHDGDDATELL